MTRGRQFQDCLHCGPTLHTRFPGCVLVQPATLPAGYEPPSAALPHMVVTTDSSTQVQITRISDEQVQEIADAVAVRMRAEDQASQHSLVYVQPGSSAFIQAVCQCGDALMSSGTDSLAWMLSRHIKEKRAQRPDPGMQQALALLDAHEPGAEWRGRDFGRGFAHARDLIQREQDYGVVS